MRLNRTRLCASAAILCLALPVEVCAADIALSAMAGEWIGRGQAREAVDAPLDPVYCRLSGRLDGAGTLLEQTGRCAAGNRNYGFKAHIEQSGASYRMELSGRQGQEPITLLGRRQGDRIVFRAADSASAEAVTAVDLEFLANGYRMTVGRQAEGANGTYTSASLVFTRR